MRVADADKRRSMAVKIGTILFLGFNSWSDIRRRQISLWFTGIFALLGLGNAIWEGRSSLWFLFPVGVGIGLLALSVVTGGALGMGDAWIVAALGIVLKPEEFAATLSIGLFLAAVWAAILLAVFGKSRKTEFPFVPFLLLGYLGGLCL